MRFSLKNCGGLTSFISSLLHGYSFFNPANALLKIKDRKGVFVDGTTECSHLKADFAYPFFYFVPHVIEIVFRRHIRVNGDRHRFL